MTQQPAVAQTELASSLAEELRALVGKLKRTLRAQTDHGDFPPAQAAILLRLEKTGPSTVTNLARAERMRPQSMGTAISSLQNAGLVKGTADPNDGRQTIISLTTMCRQMLQKSRAARQDWLTRAIQAKLSSKEQHDLAKAIALLQRLVDDAIPASPFQPLSVQSRRGSS